MVCGLWAQGLACAHRPEKEQEERIKGREDIDRPTDWEEVEMQPSEVREQLGECRISKANGVWVEEVVSQAPCR